MVIIFSCSHYANGKHVKSAIVGTVMASTTATAAKPTNEVNENSSDVLLKRANVLPKARRRSANDDDDGYVMEDMNLMQQDQPYSPYRRHHPFQMQKDLPQQNWQLTDAVLIKQGHLKGVVRPMHPHTGLRNVNQYLGIPYAAPPIGNGRFMPPGLCTSYHIFPFVLCKMGKFTFNIPYALLINEPLKPWHSKMASSRISNMNAFYAICAIYRSSQHMLYQLVNMFLH